MKKKYNIFISLLLPLLVCLLYGYTFPAVKLTYMYCGVDEASRANLYVFAGYRFLFSGLVLFVPAILKGEFRTFAQNMRGRDERGKSPLPKVLLFLLSASILQIVINSTTTYICIDIVGSAFTSLLKKIGPLLLIPFYCLMFRDETLTVGKLLGAVFGLAGVLILNLGAYDNIGIGSLVALIPALSLVLSDIFVKKLKPHCGSFAMTSLLHSVGGVILGAYGYLTGGHTPTFRAAATGEFSWIGILIALSLLFVSAFGMWLWNYLVQNGELSHLGIIRLSETMFAALLSFLLLGENSFTVNFFISFALLVIAVVLSQYVRKEIRWRKKAME